MGWKTWAALAGGLAAVGLLGLGAAGYAMFGGLVPIEDGRQVGHLRTVQDGYVAAYIGQGADGSVFLVDAGNDPEAKALLAALSALGRGPDDVKAIFLTHGHQDHVRGCARFPKAEVVALAAEAPVVSGEAKAKGPLPRWVANDGSCRVTRTVVDGEVVDVGGTSVQAFALPGHTAGSVAWLVGGDTLALGDAASATTSGELVPSPWVFNDDTEASAAILAGLDARLPEGVVWFVPAHSGPLRGPERR